MKNITPGRQNWKAGQRSPLNNNQRDDARVILVDQTVENDFGFSSMDVPGPPSAVSDSIIKS